MFNLPEMMENIGKKIKKRKKETRVQR